MVSNVKPNENKTSKIMLRRSAATALLWCMGTKQDHVERRFRMDDP